MDNSKQNNSPVKKTYLFERDTVVGLEKLKQDYRFSSVGRVIDYLVKKELGDSNDDSAKLDQLLNGMKAIRAIENENSDTLNMFTEVMNTRAISEMWPTELVGTNSNKSPLLAAAKDEADKRRVEKIKSRQYGAKR